MAERGLWNWIGNKVADRLFELIMVCVVPIASIVGLSIWAYVREFPAPIIAMIALPGLAICVLSAFAIGKIYTDLFSKRAKLKIEYDPRRHHTVDGNGFAATRFLIRNKNRNNIAQNLVVLIESLVDITSDVAHPQAASFINVPMRFERPDSNKDGVILKAHRTVEVFGPKAPKNSDQFFFPTSDPHAGDLGAFFSGVTQYQMIVFAAADNADPVREDMRIFTKDGIMCMLPKGDPKAPAPLKTTNMPSQSAATPTNQTDAFIGTWQIVSKPGHSGFAITLYKDNRAMRAHPEHVPQTAIGVWCVAGNEARIEWPDGWWDALRPQKNGTVLKAAFYGPNKSWDGPSHNEQQAIKS